MKYSRARKESIFFACFIMLPLIFALLPLDRLFVKYPVFACSLAVFLYIIYFSIRLINIPGLYNNRKYLRIIFFFVGLIFAIYIMAHFPFSLDVNEIDNATLRRSMRIRIQTVWLISLVVAGYAFSSSLWLEMLRQNELHQELIDKQRTAELALYKAQINPHFLFNTLNTLYGLIVSGSKNVEDAFIKFTDLIKYTYPRMELEYIPIRDEIKYIKSYIDLQTLRLNDHTIIEFNQSIEDDNLLVPPMIFISFIENAFKYGVSNHADCKIKIDISLQGKVLTFECINLIMCHPPKSGDTSIGIANTRARLDRLYPGQYELHTGKLEDRYIVKLKINDIAHEMHSSRRRASRS